MVNSTHSRQVWPIDDEKSFPTNWYMQIVYLWKQFVLCKVQLTILAGPECEFFNISNYPHFLQEIHDIQLDSRSLHSLYVPEPNRSGKR